MNTFMSYLLGNIMASIISLSGCLIFTAFGIIQCTFTFQMTAYIRVLRDHLEYNGPRDSGIYQQHKLLIRILNDYNELFAGQIYLEILVSSVMPCGFLYAIIKALRRGDNSKLDLIQQICMALASPFVICPCGQLISTEMEKLHESSYMSEWYEEKPKIRRDLLTLMTMTTKLIVPNYRLFIRFDHVCLASVCQGLYSFIMMIINFDSE
ncbi:hypothetical protein O3M35_009735 [Rhynocoris fuscipes]|uniref:Uncharacterized protein n=1 Tax=Rhynocoris fuscipes TaxID=488301 RepID=A0AAW1D4T3_9HEMI